MFVLARPCRVAVCPVRFSSTADSGRTCLLWTLLAVVLMCVGGETRLAAQAPTPVLVPTWRYDNTEQGQNTNETALTPANVSASTFGKLFSHSVDGAVYAQPLYVPALSMPDGLVHNVMFIATEHDSVYAFDADSNSGANANPLWQVTLLDAAHGAAPGATTVPSSITHQADIAPEIGITSTPVIDPATNTIYIVSKSAESGGYVQRLHALDLFTGAEKLSGPVVLQATVNGTGAGSSGGKVSFNALLQNQRSALMLYNGHIYIAFASHGDFGAYHGWVMAYDASTLAQTAALCLSPNGMQNGVWASGAGMPIDENIPGGEMYLVTGNGSYATYPPFAGAEFGDSVVSIDLSNGGLTPLDAFTPFNQTTLSAADLDQGSGGILMLPDQQGAFPHILVQAGKEGRIVVLNRDNLGGYAAGATSNTNALQDIPNQVKGLWSTPAYWNGNVYIWGTGDYGSFDTPKLFKLNSGVLDTTPASVAAISAGHPGGIFSVSSNGASNGIAWAVRTDGFTTHADQILYAWDANDLTKLLYASNTNSTRDSPGSANKFAIPVVTNGKVYVAALQRINVYGLFNTTPLAATPVISPNGGTFSAAQTVSITSSTSSANIYYTLNGTNPTASSTQYTAPLNISSDTTLSAIAVAPNFVQSATATATFNFSTQTPPVTFQPSGGTYSSPQTISLADADSSASIYYTTDGSAPTASSHLYGAPIPVSSSETVQAIAVDPSLTNSNVTAASYVIQAGSTAIINFANGFATSTGLTLNGNAIPASSAQLALTTGAAAQKGSIFWSQPVGIQSFTTDFTFQITNPQADGMTFTIQNVGRTALGGGASGLGYIGLPKSVAIKFDLFNNSGEGTDSTGVFINGATPTIPTLDMTSSGVNLHSGDPLLAHVTYDGTTLTVTLTDQTTKKAYTFSKAINIAQTVGASTAFVGFTGSTGGLASTQKLLNWTYTTPLQSQSTPAPVFNPSGGSYTTTQNVALTDSAAAAVIYYTTDGTTPTTSSSVYSSPIAIGSGSTTINAFAIVSGSTASNVVSATYVVGTAAPTFSPAAGTYSQAQSVALSDATAGAVIYYTTDGTAPTSSSTKYTAPISVAATETIKALAIANAQSSAVASATYAIQPATAPPAVNFANGFSSAAGLSLKGQAIVTANLLRLTLAGSTVLNGAAWYTTPVSVSAFTTDFDFQLLSAKADGFTFTLQNAGVTAQGPGGSGLGYGASQPNGTGGIGHSVAIKFDLYNNDGEGTDSTGFYTNGASPTIPATDMASSGVLLNSGHVLHAHITYDGTNLTLLLTDKSTSASFTATAAINIPAAVGSATAFAGFTGGIGGSSMTAEILNWTLTNP
jgi:Chitobiase/beta-hexosaminidase C-terminal domain/Bacterial lectin